MVSWQDLSEAEKRVLDDACDEGAGLWEFVAPLTFYGDDERGEPTVTEVTPLSRDDALAAVTRLHDLGLIELLRSTEQEELEPVDAGSVASVLANEENWTLEGAGAVEVGATDDGRRVLAEEPEPDQARMTASRPPSDPA